MTGVRSLYKEIFFSFNKQDVNLQSSLFCRLNSCEVLTFEEGFLKHQVVNIEPSGEPSVVITKANVTTFLQGQQLLDFFLDTARNVLVNVYQTNDSGAPKSQCKVLYWSADWKARVRVLVGWLQVVHGVCCFVLFEREDGLTLCPWRGGGAS